MDARVKKLNSSLKIHDRDLFCKRDSNGTIHIYRNSISYDAFYFDEKKYLYSRTVPHVILSLTHNWGLQGVSVDWGIEPIIHRLKEIDSWNRQDLEKILFEQYEKSEAQKEKDFKNRTEAYLYDEHKMFRRAFSDINVSSLEKIDKRRMENGISK